MIAVQPDSPFTVCASHSCMHVLAMPLCNDHCCDTLQLKPADATAWLTDGTPSEPQHQTPFTGELWFTRPSTKPSTRPSIILSAILSTKPATVPSTKPSTVLSTSKSPAGQAIEAETRRQSGPRLASQPDFSPATDVHLRDLRGNISCTHLVDKHL